MRVWYRAWGGGGGGRGENYARWIYNIRRPITKFPAKTALSAGTSSMLLNLKLHITTPAQQINNTLSYSKHTFCYNLTLILQRMALLYLCIKISLKKPNIIMATVTITKRQTNFYSQMKYQIVTMQV